VRVLYHIIGFCHVQASNVSYPVRLNLTSRHNHRLLGPLTMDDLREQVELLESSANLSNSINDVQKAIDLLTAARAKMAAGECLSMFNEACSPTHLRPEDSACDPRETPGPLQKDAGRCTEGPEADLLWPEQVWQGTGQGIDFNITVEM
jgi:hypothetical protein